MKKGLLISLLISLVLPTSAAIYTEPDPSMLDLQPCKRAHDIREELRSLNRNTRLLNEILGFCVESNRARFSREAVQKHMNQWLDWHAKRVSKGPRPKTGATIEEQVEAFKEGMHERLSEGEWQDPLYKPEKPTSQKKKDIQT